MSAELNSEHNQFYQMTRSAKSIQFTKSRSGAKSLQGSNSLFTQPAPQGQLRGDLAGSAHTVKAPAFPIPSGGEGLVYSLR